MMCFNLNFREKININIILKQSNEKYRDSGNQGIEKHLTSKFNFCKGQKVLLIKAMKRSHVGR